MAEDRDPGRGRPRRRGGRRVRSDPGRAWCGNAEPGDLQALRSILARLDALARSLLRRELLGQAPTGPIGPVRLELDVYPAAPSEEGDRAAALLAALRTRVQEIGDGVVALRPGRVYCFWCRSNACEHGRPDTPRQVFLGYDPTGRPRFTDFADLVLARGDPRIEGLYRDPPEPIAIYDGGKTLRSAQLPFFGGASAACNILGQVAIGYLPFAAPRPGERQVLSLTLQAIQARRRDGGMLLDLNILGLTPEGTLDQWLDSAFDGAVRAGIERARRCIREVGRRQRSHGDRETLEAAVEPFLNELARTLERFVRQAGRRTTHVRDRRRQGDRPTNMALEDARRVRAGALFWDDKHGTYIVVGPRGRTHVFNPDGRHVTSVVYSRDAFERKQKLKLWRELSREESAAFFRALPR
ncbi:MAG: hypothetical protein JXQ29_16605 [Planctomycetes bacterium]|nr:hypothetical protein [Planctomycetota bacterium]